MRQVISVCVCVCAPTTLANCQQTLLFWHWCGCASCYLPLLPYVCVCRYLRVCVAAASICQRQAQKLDSISGNSLLPIFFAEFHCVNAFSAHFPDVAAYTGARSPSLSLTLVHKRARPHSGRANETCQFVLIDSSTPHPSLPRRRGHLLPLLLCSFYSC